MELYKKPPLTFSQQLDLLISRGLTVLDRSMAERFLSQISYYRLSAYCLPFEITRHQFKPNVTFERIQQLYEFDRRFRFLIDEALEVAEIAFRTKLAYHLVHKYEAFVHEDPSKLFHKFNHTAWLARVHDEAVRSKETFIEHYKAKYDGFPKLPLWMAVEVMSFGTLSQLYGNLLKDDQITIAKAIGFHSSVLISWLHTFTYIRNLCAHHSRLWNRELSIAMIAPSDGQWNSLKAKRVATVVFAINRFLSKMPLEPRIRGDWHSAMTSLLNRPVDIPNFYGAMGFPQDFQNHVLWKAD